MDKRPRWQLEAACRSFPAELFFPVGTSDIARADRERAKGVCRQCPVRAECLQFALDTNQEFGVWGGLSEDERRVLMPVGRPRPRSRVTLVASR